MAKNKNTNPIRQQLSGNKKRTVVVNTTKEQQPEGKPKLPPTTSRSQHTDKSGPPASDMLFGKENFILLGAGAALVFIGILLMSGGQQPDDQWNPNEIYSIRRTYIAPVVILLGLVAALVSIFRKKASAPLA